MRKIIIDDQFIRPNQFFRIEDKRKHSWFIRMERDTYSLSKWLCRWRQHGSAMVQNFCAPRTAFYVSKSGEKSSMCCSHLILLLSLLDPAQLVLSVLLATILFRKSGSLLTLSHPLSLSLSTKNDPYSFSPLFPMTHLQNTKTALFRASFVCFFSNKISLKTVILFFHSLLWMPLFTTRFPFNLPTH